MKTFTLLIFLNFPLVILAQSSGGLTFESTNHDFGTIPSGADAIATFLFSNNSTIPVEILKIHGENHCLEIDNSSLKNYAPKEKGIITATYDTNCVGPIRKTLSVFTSTKDNTITLKLTGKVSEK